MKEHFHSLFVTQTVSEVVDILRSYGLTVDYNPKKPDLEDANGHIEKNGGVISSCIRWRRDPNHVFMKDVPEEVMACLQLLSSAENFTEVLSIIIGSDLNIIKGCPHC